MRSDPEKKKIQLLRRAKGTPAPAGGLLPVPNPSHGSNVASRPHAVSPRLARPLARTHARTKRNDFPVWTHLFPQPPIYVYIYIAYIFKDVASDTECISNMLRSSCPIRGGQHSLQIRGEQIWHKCRSSLGLHL